jgi:hypothetical protein
MAWTRRIAVVIDHTKVSTATQTNFTIPIVVTHSELRTIANGGLVNDGTKDAAYFSDAACTTMLKFQRVSYSPTTGVLICWVKIPSLSNAVDTTIYLGYANSSISTDQQDAVNAWDASTAAAYHFGDGTTLNLVDHLGNFTLTNVGTAAAAAGLIGGAVSTNGSTSYLQRTTSTPASAYPLTIETLMKPAASVATSQTVVGLGLTGAGTTIGFLVQARATDAVRGQAGNTSAAPQSANGVLDTTNWHYIGAAYTSDTSRSLIVDAGAEITSAASTAPLATPDNISVGTQATNSGHNQFFNGLVNFVIVSTVARSAGWRATRQAATKGIATFSTAGSPTTVTPASIVQTQPASSVTSGVAMAHVVFAATTDGTTVDTSFTGNCVVTINTPAGYASGSLGGTTTVACVAGVADCTNLIPTVDGPAYTLTGTMPGYTAVTTNPFTGVGPVVAANQAFVTAMGGDAALITANDPRILANGALTSLADVIGAIGGRAAGCTMAGSGATIAAGKVSLVAANTPYYASAADSRLDLTGGTFATPKPVWLLVIGAASSGGGGGELANISSDPTSTTTYPYARARALAGTWQAAFASDGAAPSGSSTPIPRTAGAFVSDTGVTATDSVIRAMAIGKMGYQSPTTDQSTQVNGAWGFVPSMGGEQPRFIHRATPSTAGSCKLAFGRFGSTYIDGTLSWLGVLTGDLTLAKLKAFQAFARTQFGATIDIVAVPSLAFTGNSHVTSQTDQPGGDMQTPINTSGTTSMPYYMAHKVSGRGSLIQQGLKLADTHAYSWGRSGKNITQVLDTFDVEVGLLADGTRTGAICVLFYDIGNAIGPGVAMTQTTYLNNLIALKAKCDALATASGLVVNLVQLPDSDRQVYYNASWPTIPTGHSSEGTLRLSIGSALAASVSTYGAAVFDMAANVAIAAIGNFAAPSCYSTTNYNINANAPFAGGDSTHGAPPLYQAMGEALKTLLFDVNESLLYPRRLQKVLNLHRQRRA